MRGILSTKTKLSNGASDVECRPKVHEWMRAIRSPTPYRVGSTVTLNTVMLAKAGIGLLLVLTCVVLIIPATDYTAKGNIRFSQHPEYNSTYPLSEPIRLADGSTKFRIGIISDPDTDSKSRTEKNTWISYLRTGYLTVSGDHSRVSVEFDEGEQELKSSLSLKVRLRPSETVFFSSSFFFWGGKGGLS